MNEGLIDWLWNTGILQFGYFVKDEGVSPVRFCPEYLPAYPQLLIELAQQTLSQLNFSEIDYLLVTADSVPLGVACSLETGLSIVYSRGRGEPVVYDLVVSYNSGHTTTLLTNCINNVATLETFISTARSVGLETHSIVSLLDMKTIDELAGIPVRSVFRLVDVVQELLAIGRLTDGQTQAVMKWIDEKES